MTVRSASSFRKDSGEIRFESPAQLKQQLEQDRERSLMVLQGHDPDPLHIFADEKSGT